MKRLLFISLIMIIVLSSFPANICTGYSVWEHIERPFVAYKAQSIPDIDGLISPGEWNDTEIYEFNVSNTGIMNGTVIRIQCALKHDNDWLYFLFTINDDDNDYDVVAIFTKPWSEEGESDDILCVTWDNTIKFGNLTRSGLRVNWTSSPLGEVNSTYSNESKEYTFEIKISMSYLQIKNSSAVFYIVFGDMGVWWLSNSTLFICPQSLILLENLYTGNLSDLDKDGIPDMQDDDIDGDGVPNNEDKYPYDPTKWREETHESKMGLWLYILVGIAVIMVFIALVFYIRKRGVRFGGDRDKG